MADVTLPDFLPDGLLPPGDYPLTLAQLRQSALVAGTGAPDWDAAWRARLVDNLATLIQQLWQVGIDAIFVDGSFAEAKGRPNDIDGYFLCAAERLFSGELEDALNALDPDRVWTWDPARRLPFKGYPKKQLPMWHRYRVELFPHYGQLCGIVDTFGHPLQFPAAFRRSRTGQPKGILKIER